MTIQPGQIHFLFGGARSGKSSRAEALARETGAAVVFVSTCATDRSDPEMLERLLAHQARRPATWQTVENRFDLEGVFAEHPGSVMLLDCLTLWLSWHLGLGWEEKRIAETLERALLAVAAHGIRLYLVSNELGMGLVPMGADNRAFRDLCGRANQLVARHASVVEFVAAGLPLRLK